MYSFDPSTTASIRSIGAGHTIVSLFRERIVVDTVVGERKIRISLPEPITPGSYTILARRSGFAVDVNDAQASVVYDGDISSATDIDFSCDYGSWYVTVFLGTTLDTTNGVGYVNLLSPSEDLSEVMYSYMPRLWRTQDTDNVLAVLTKVLGSGLTEAQTSLLHLNDTRYDPYSVGIEGLRHIDYLLSWVTNLTADVRQRRSETAQVIDLIKARGTALGLEQVVQVTTGWDATIRDSYPNVLQTFTKPDDSDNAELQALRSSLPANETYSAEADRTRSVAVTAEPSSWASPSGLLIDLVEPTDGALGLADAVLNRLRQVVPLFVPFYASYGMVLNLRPVSELIPIHDESSSVELFSQRGEGLSTEDTSPRDVSPNKAIVETFPHSLFYIEQIIGDSRFVLPHSRIDFTGEYLTGEDFMATMLTLAQPQTVEYIASDVPSKARSIPVKITASDYGASRTFTFETYAIVTGDDWVASDTSWTLRLVRTNNLNMTPEDTTVFSASYNASTSPVSIESTIPVESLSDGFYAVEVTLYNAEFDDSVSLGFASIVVR